jgi:hypothetical protein
MNDENKHPLLDTFEQSPEQFVDNYAEMLKSAVYKAFQKEIAKLEDELAAMRDCRTCAKAARYGNRCLSVAQCVNGDLYVAVPPIQLWEKR